MNNMVLGVLVLMLFLIGCIIASNSGYDKGFYDGLRNFCPEGDLLVDELTGKITCDYENNLNNKYDWVLDYEV